jgi:single-stranded DNA-binding protein
MKKHFVVGNLVSAVAIATNGAKETGTMTVAVNEYKKANGEQVVSFHSVVITGQAGFLANVKEYLTKGKGVSLAGTPYVSTNEKDNHVYRNPGIRLQRLGDLRFTGQDIAAAPVVGSVEEQRPQAEADALKNSEELLKADQQDPTPAPTFDQNDDDIPFAI